ncbi:MAG: hypothetical protein NZ937_07360 [Armatimonadetes bacterium]|nr:hypothetical protein [Armatimonadota bacterium]MDW8028559.1 hypothetical protein [Armatimonadota bacterium]
MWDEWFEVGWLLARKVKTRGYLVVKKTVKWVTTFFNDDSLDYLLVMEDAELLYRR